MSWLQFNQSILAALEKIWSQLAEVQALTFLQKLRQFFEGTLPPEKAKPYQLAIEVLGIGNQVEAIRQFLERIPPSAWQLFSALSQVQDTLTLPIVNEKEDGLKIPGPGSLGLSLELSAEASLQAFSARQNIDLVPDLKIQAGQTFLLLEAIGRVSIGAGGSGNFGSGSVNLDVSTGGSVELGYLFEDVPSSLVIASLLRHLPQLCQPFDLERLGGSFQKELRAVSLQAQGNLNVSGGLQLGQSWGTEIVIDQDAMGLHSPIGIQAAADLGITAAIRLEGGFDLLVQPAANDWISVQLKRSSDRSKNLAINLQSQIEIHGLDVVGRAILDRYIPDAQPLIQELTPYLDLKGLLINGLSQQLSGVLNSPEAEPLRNQLATILIGQTSSEDLVNALLDFIGQSVNSQLDAWSGDAKSYVERVIHETATRLGLTPESTQLLQEKVSGPLTERLAQAKSELEDFLRQWVESQPKTTLLKVLKPLDAFGAKVGELLDDTQNLVNRILEPVLEFLDKYQGYRNKVQKAVDGAAKLKIGLNFSKAWQATKAGGLMLNLELDPSSAEAKEFYKQISLGSFHQILAAVQKAADEGTNLPGVRLVSGSFRQVLGKKVQTDFSIDLGQTTGSSQSLRELQLEATWDLSGNILTATGSSQVQQIFKFLGETRSAQFVNLLELAGTGQSDAAKLFSSSVSLTFRDEKIKVSEIQGIFENLERLGLIQEGLTQRTVSQYDAMDHQNLGAAIGISLPLENADLRRFLSKSRSEVLIAGFTNNLDVFRERAENKRAVREFLQTNISGATLIAKLDTLLNGAGDPFTARQVFGGGRVKFEALAYQAWTYARYANVLFNMQQIMKQVAAISLVGPHRNANLQTIYGLLDNFNKEVNMVLKVRKWLDFFVKNSVPKTTLAFLLSLRALSSENDQSSPLVPVIRWAKDGQLVDQIML